MALSPAGADTTKTKSRMTAWISGRRPWFQVALLLVATGVLYAAVTVAAAREPDSMDAYAPPPPPGASHLSQGQDGDTSVGASADFVSADPSVVAQVPAISAEVVSAPAAVEAPAEMTVEEQTPVEVPATATHTSSVVESPELVASSWSMDPLPEGEGGTVGSSTSVDPITPTSSIVASPQ